MVLINRTRLLTLHLNKDSEQPLFYQFFSHTIWFLEDGECFFFKSCRVKICAQSSSDIHNAQLRASITAATVK